MSSTIADPRAGPAFFGHPRGLANLFGVEMWERFSYYGMLASRRYTCFTRRLETTPAWGCQNARPPAWSVLRRIGLRLDHRRRVDGRPGTRRRTDLVLQRRSGDDRAHRAGDPAGLCGRRHRAGIVALGSGGVKGNATAIIGTLYAENDDRRDAGFSLFYMGINTGALIGPLLTGLAWTTLSFTPSASPPSAWPPA